MNIHEFQAKALLKQFGIPVPEGYVAGSVAEAAAALQRLDAKKTVVKAQIHAGGRGRAGGIVISDTREAAEQAAGELLGKTLVTPQTGPAGQDVRRVLLEQGQQIAAEFYLAVTIDREKARLVMIGSHSGGMDIEEVALSHPEHIFKEEIDPVFGLQPFQARRLAWNMGLTKAAAASGAKLMQQLFQLFIESDCTIVEINPLAITDRGELLALDAKISFDDNALYRQPEIVLLKDIEAEDPKERVAAENGLSYIALDGNIGCMVNGAGLAMATMDLIKHYGGDPANFLDVGGDATAEKVSLAFRLILEDANVEGVFVNIFGGIMKCDVIAHGIAEAARLADINIPVVVRLEGTNQQEGRKLLAETGLNLVSVSTLSEGAEKIISLLK